jgi:tetratricopeptide (TPR) repeat protein
LGSRYQLEPEKLTAEGYFAVGNRYFQQKQLTAARECYQKAIQRRDSYTSAWQNLGEVCFWQQQ